jgi:hypothetical protein
LIGDLATLSLAVHAPVCGAMLLLVFKTGGESKFGKQCQEEMKATRGALLRSISSSLADTLQPILTLANSIEVPKLLIVDQGEVRRSPTITPIGAEKLLNAVRDFVKSDATLMLALRALDEEDSCITHHLKRLRLSTFAAFIASGVFAVAAIIMKAEMFKSVPPWPFITAFILLMLILTACAYCALRVTLSINCLEDLRERYAHLS